MTDKSILDKAIKKYSARHVLERPQAVLFDMDGILYDSMPLHARAWKRMCDLNGIQADENEFYGYEGRTGASTINILFNRQYGHGADDDLCKLLYAQKSEFFKAMPAPAMMPGAKAAVDAVIAAGLRCVLVTGSAQHSVLDRLERDYSGAFSIRVTGLDVKHGKPHPEPFLKGLDKAGIKAWQAVAVDNAPLGVRSAADAGIFTIGVRTGPLPKGALLEAGADIELDSMDECAQMLKWIFNDYERKADFHK